MRTRIALCLAVVICLCENAAEASAWAKPSSVEATILAIDRAWGQAYVTGQIDVIDRTLAPDWRGWTDTSGSDKATEIADLKSGKNRSLENIIDDARVRIYGNTAVLEGRERVRYRDRTGEHWLTWHITDVFVKLNGRWQVVASHGSTIPNPKPVQHPSAARGNVARAEENRTPAKVVR